uniref:Uncharacterized protein n=1 Tax=viral metagenome TaxID=1070528 RepID=A0A6H1ZPP3_9ZZZZ
MSEYDCNYDWWMAEHGDMLTWAISDDGAITLGNILKALHQHPDCYIAMINHLTDDCECTIGEGTAKGYIDD